MARLADGEDDVVRQLWEQQDVGDVGLEGLLEQGRGAPGGEQDDRRPSVLPDPGDLVRRQLRAAGRVQHDLEVASGERRGASEHLLARSDELDLGVTLERFLQVGQPVAGARQVHAHPVAGH